MAIERRREVSSRNRARRRVFVFGPSLTLILPSRDRSQSRADPGQLPGIHRSWPCSPADGVAVPHRPYAIEYPLSRSLAGHVDPEVVGIADEGVTPSFQLVIEVVEHDVGQKRR